MFIQFQSWKVWSAYSVDNKEKKMYKTGIGDVWLMTDHIALVTLDVVLRLMMFLWDWDWWCIFRTSDVVLTYNIFAFQLSAVVSLLLGYKNIFCFTYSYVLYSLKLGLLPPCERMVPSRACTVCTRFITSMIGFSEKLVSGFETV